MATRSIIAKLEKGTNNTDDTILAIYCHHDGYLNHNGVILNEHYQDESKIDELLAGGDLSFLGCNIGEKLDFDDIESFRENEQCSFYHRDRNEAKQTARQLADKDELIKHSSDSWADYIYLYENGKWYVRCSLDVEVKIDGLQMGPFIELEEALSLSPLRSS